jgi:hypothetical protein
VLDRLQRGLERLYRVETELAIDDFVIDGDRRDQLGVGRRPREQLLLREQGGELELALFVDMSALGNLAANDPSQQLHDGNFGDFLLAVEGVSHFVYLVWRARRGQPVSALELELQAEVDKYITCLLACEGADESSRALRQRLFVDCEYEQDLDAGERDRYQLANLSAYRYSGWLEQRFVQPRRLPEMLMELRHFYRLSLAGKLDRIRGS